jgi:hypothetical protein
MSNSYQLEKTTWSDPDFDRMSWHDCPIHAFSFNDEFELLLDIDYIFEWVQPQKGERFFKFWIAPCTLIFENVYDITFDSEHKQPVIDYVGRSNPQKPKNSDYIGRDTEYDWDIVMVSSELSFKSVGFKQFVRQNPILSRNQCLKTDERGEISFGMTFKF